jgi:flagellar basal body P-ring protein FlgI
MSFTPAPSSGRRRRWRDAARAAARLTLCAAGLLALTGCPKPEAPPTPKSRHPTVGPDTTLPVYLKGTVKDLTLVANTGVFPVSSYGLVTGLRGTGDSTAPSLVREWMLKEMTRHGLGRSSLGFENLTPEQLLTDPHVAIVSVVANIPPGARKGDQVDVIVEALPNNSTSSLANGMLWRTNLKINGMSDPFGAVNEYAKAQGNLFVNPVYAINVGGGDGAPATQATSALVSLRTGLIPGGGYVTSDRPIHLVLRTPGWAASRTLENRINQHFQTTDVFRDPTAASQDEGYIHLFVPHAYHGDWQHFMGVVTHLYMNGDNGFLALKAHQLAEEALKPDSALLDISYAWEAMGPAAIPSLTPLLSNPQPEVQFAAARAAAFIGDRYGEDTLVQIARTAGHPFQVNAVQTLGELPSSALINAQLATLLDSDQSLVRIEAYKVLAEHQDGHVFSKLVHSKLNPENEFTLDLIASNGPPLVYCSRMGRPRVAVFGRHVSLETPVMFSAFDTRLTISTRPDRPRTVDIFYRDELRRTPIEALSGPDVGELVARLGGASEEGFHFTYGDVVAILQSMVQKKALPAAFVLQQAPWVEREIHEAPQLPDSGRPQTEASTIAPTTQPADSLPEMPLPPPPEDKKKDKDKDKQDKQNKNESANSLSGRPQ